MGKDTNIIIRIKQSEKEKIQKYCEENETTISALIRTILKKIINGGNL